MNTIIPPGAIVGILSCAALLANAAHYPALGVFISDPHTAEAVTTVVSSVGALWAGILRGLQK